MVVWENHRMIPVGLEPGRYAISFRRLPEQVDYPLPERLP